ncbi:macro domain-containing protein PG1779 isoform X1 [Lepeophtheirus salmonis]|uniref:macro domain-containing protein PG1779 isoform X1 n=1 Tax=Lepeophtheirus salmonis TaxID=72036 RepID=UPI001AE5F34D|nr:macro domain-containing protein mll7730-like isoform X1 [Lepeophtheirus salmonis]
MFVSSLFLLLIQPPRLRSGFTHIIEPRYISVRQNSNIMEDRRNNYFCGPDFVGLEDVRKDWTSDVSDDKIGMWQGDITKLEIDAIVNAANSGLRAGGGVCGAIHRAAGLDLQKECNSLNGCPPGESKITSGYKLPAKCEYKLYISFLYLLFQFSYYIPINLFTDVIHTVGPQDQDPDILRSAYRNSMELLMSKGLRSIAFPCIGTGIYGFPSDKAAGIALETVRSVLKINSDKFDAVIFCVFLNKDKDMYKELLSKKF